MSAELMALDLEVNPKATEVVEFYGRPVVDKKATEAEGRTVHKDGVYVKIILPGDKNLLVDRPMRETDKQLYPRQWAAFQANKPQELSGTQLSSWGAISQARVEDYRYFRIQTVEQLASVSDSNLPALGMGAAEDRRKAKDFLEMAKSRAPLMRLQAEFDQEKAQRAALEVMLHKMSAKLDSLGGFPAPAVGQFSPDTGLPLAGSAYAAAPASEAPPAPPKRGRGRPKSTHKETT